MFGRCNIKNNATLGQWDTTVTDVAPDAPEFRREYKTKLTDEISCTITARTFLGRNFSGELDQSNGRWVLFEPARPADRILDKNLVPLVEDFCEEVFKLDRQFIRSDPSDFVDKKGQRWVRK